MLEPEKVCVGITPVGDWRHDMGIEPYWGYGGLPRLLSVRARRRLTGAQAG